MPVYTVQIDRDRREIDVSKRIAELEPDDSPFTVILMRARKIAATSAEVIWWEDQLGARWTQINNATGYNYDATTIVVDDGSIFAAKDILKVPRTGETMLVTAVSTNTLTVVRDFGQTRPGANPAAYNLLDNDWVLNIGNAMEEGSRAPAEKLGQPVKKFNYCQIFRTPFSVTGTTMAERQVTNEQERTRLSRIKAKEHRIDIERAVLFGERREYVSGTEIRRTLGGLTQFISTNVYDAGGTLTESEFENDFCEQIFKYGSSTKLLVASDRLISVINGFGREKLQIVPRDQSYGVRMARYISAHGDLLIVKSKVLINYYAGWGIVVDPENIEYKPLRDTVLKRNIQDSEEDAVRDEYFTEATVKILLEKTHGIIKNVTG